MNTRLTLVALTVASFSGAAHAATFEAPRPYQILLVDGEKTKHSLLKTVHAANLSGGQHQLVLEFVEDHSNRQQVRVMEGDPVIINIDAPVDAELGLEYTKPVNYQQTREFLRDQVSEITVVDQRTGQAIDADMFTVHRPAGMDTARGVQEYLVETNRAFSGQTNAAVAAAQAKFGDAAVDADALEMLKHWWSAADKDTKRAFQIWTIQQQ